MTISGSGFGELGGEGFPVIRKPNEGEFSLVLPSGIPMPFKETVEVTLLTVSDSDSVQEAEAVVLTQHIDPPSVSFADEDVVIQDGDVVFEPLDTKKLVVFATAHIQTAESVELTEDLAVIELTVEDSANEQYADAPSLEQEHTLSVSDAASDNVCDVVSIEVEGVLAVSDTLQENVSDALTLDIEAVLTVSEGAQAQYADDVTIEEILPAVDLVLSDSTQAQVADTVGVIYETPIVTFKDEDVVFKSEDVVFTPHEISGTATLTVADGTQVQLADGGSENVFTQEHVAEVFDSADEQTAETAELEQEHNLTLSDSANEQTAGAVILGVDGIDNVLAEDCSQAQYTDSVTLAVISKVGRQKPLMARLAQIPVQEEQPEDEFYLSYYLRVASGDVGNVADTVQLSESQEIGARSTTASVADNAVNVITLTQKRRKRFVQEDEIILLAA